MIIKSFVTRDDALVTPDPGVTFRYENGWPFLEMIRDGQTFKLIRASYIIDMEVEVPIPQECMIGHHIWDKETNFVKTCIKCGAEEKQQLSVPDTEI